MLSHFLRRCQHLVRRRTNQDGAVKVVLWLPSRSRPRPDVDTSPARGGAAPAAPGGGVGGDEQRARALLRDPALRRTPTTEPDDATRPSRDAGEVP